jgi:predicted NBD/HSP70 family sugar kinase
VASAIATAVTTLGATDIVLGGELAPAGEDLLAMVQGIVAANVVPALRPAVCVRYATMGQSGAARGAALQAIDESWLYADDATLELGAVR